MLKKFLQEVIVSIVGKPGEQLVELLHSSKHVNEFLIAKKLDITINQTRNLLYKISDFGLVSSIRKKDKKKGWYTYFWKIEVLKSLDFLKKLLNKNIEHLEQQLKSRKEKQFYVCERCNIEITEENALLHDFICPECGEVYTLKDNSAVVRDLERARTKLEKQKEMVEEEIKNERGKIEKSRARKEKREQKEKAKKRAAKRDLKKKSLAKQKTSSKAKKTSKKSSKKSSSKQKTSSKAKKKKTSKKSSRKK